MYGQNYLLMNCFMVVSNHLLNNFFYELHAHVVTNVANLSECLRKIAGMKSFFQHM